MSLQAAGRVINDLVKRSAVCASLFRQPVRGISKRQVRILREMKSRSKAFELAPHKLRHRSEWADWNYSAEVFAFNQRLNEKFNENRLTEVFTSPSYENKEAKSRASVGLDIKDFTINNNQKLSKQGFEYLEEFLSSYLRFFLPQVPEEGIRSITNFLCSVDTLSKVSSSIGCDDLILTEEFPLFSQTKKDVVCALIGACLIDHGEDHTQKFIIDFITTYLQSQDLMEVWEINNPEEMLNTILKNNGLESTEPRILRETGRSTILPCIVVGMYSGKQLLGTGPGETESEAREMAAYDSLRRFFGLTASKTLFKYGQFAYGLDYAAHKNPKSFLQEWKLEIDNAKKISSTCL